MPDLATRPPSSISRRRRLPLAFLLLLTALAALPCAALALGATGGPADDEIVAIELDPIRLDTLWIATRSGTVQVSDDGGETWRLLFASETFAGDDAALLVTLGAPRTLLFTARSRVAAEGWMQSFDGGEAWEYREEIDENGARKAPVARIRDFAYDFAADPRDPERFYAVGSYGTLAVGGTNARLWGSEDGGREWPTLDERDRPGIYRRILLDPFDPDILYLGGDGLYRWRGGVRDALIGEIVTDKQPTHHVAFTIDPSTPGRLWAATSPGGATDTPTHPFGLLRSDDRGDTWTLVDDLDGDVVSELVVSPDDPNRLYWVVDGALRASGDGGATSVLLSPGPVQDLEIDPRFPGTLFAAGAGGGRISTGGCSAPDVLCVGDGFTVEVEWRDFEGTTGVGTARELAADTGAFWFFDEANLELTVKVLDGRPINGAYWVFYGSLTNVEYTLRVTAPDGRAVTYFNPLGTFASGGDIGAFPARYEG